MTDRLDTMFLVQVPTDGPEPGPAELGTFWPLVVEVGWFLIGFLAVVLLGRQLLQPLLTRIIRPRNRNNPTLRAAIVRYFRLVLLVVGALVGVAVAGYGNVLSDSALLLSAVALALGIAAQEVIGSLVSGVALVLDPEFNVGDFIQWEGGEGVVRAIALRVTRVETVDGALVTIPNTILTSHELTRPYGRERHRVVQEFNVSYQDDPGVVMAHLEDVAAGIDEVLSAPSPASHVVELGDDAVAIRVFYWIEEPDRWDVLAIQSAYAIAAKERLEAEGITVSPPTEVRLEGGLAVTDAEPNQ
jgi:small-conductance mechanosensitive channel